MDYKEIIKKILLDEGFEISDNQITIPPNKEMGDFAVPMFSFAKAQKKNPAQIATDLAPSLTNINFEKVEAAGPYINFYVDRQQFIKSNIHKILNEKFDYSVDDEVRKVVIEYISPNSNKALHIGHLRNMLLGKLYSNLLRKIGKQVHEVCLINDRGLHICKSMLAYQKFGGDEPDIKSDHFVGKYYVEFQKQLADHPGLVDEANEMLQKWEAGDKEIIALWRKMNDWAEAGQKKTWSEFDIDFEKIYYESDIYKHGKEIVEQGIEKGIFKEDEGAIIADLKEHNLDVVVAIRANGTSLYLVQDLYLALLKAKDYDADSSIYVIGNEQDHYMRQLFKILELYGYHWAKNMYHLSYGMINLKSGKMKSREGTIVETDDLIKDVTDLARAKLIEKNPATPKGELDELASCVAKAAIRYYVLKHDNKKDFTFNDEDSLRFDGDSGVYLLYTYARINSVIEKIEQGQSSFDLDSANLDLLSEDIEFELISLMSEVEIIVKEAALKHKFSSICNYLMDLARLVNSYYAKVKIIDLDDEHQIAKAALLRSVLNIMEELFDILSIKPLQKF